jgi:site-specific recombinase XerC
MSPLRQQMIAALHLSGKSGRTQDSYVREVRVLAQFYHKSPDRLSEQELQRYFLHRKNVDGLAPASMRICSSGIRFFSQHVLQRDWSTLALLRAPTTHHLPAVLSVEEVRRLLAAATPFHNQVYFTTVYSLGLRLQPSSSRSPTSMARASRSMSTAARGPKTGTSPYPPRRSRCSAPTGKPIGTRPGSFPPPGAIKNTALRRPRPCGAPVSRVPSAKPNTGPESPKPAWPSIRCGTL